MAYYAAQIANEFIEMGLKENIIVDQLKVQKLVYLAHGWHLAFFGTALIRETIEAWKYGPVVPELYRELKGAGSASLKDRIDVPTSALPIDDRTKSLLGQVWEKYGRVSGIELSAFTHQQGYAWEMARRGETIGWNSPIIPDDWIKDEFERRLERG